MAAKLTKSASGKPGAVHAVTDVQSVAKKAPIIYRAFSAQISGGVARAMILATGSCRMLKWSEASRCVMHSEQASRTF